MAVLANLYNTVYGLIQSVTSRLIVAVIIILIGFILGKILGKLTKRALHELELNALLNKITNVNVSIEEILSGFLSYFIYFLAIIMALRHIGLATDILNILSGAVILIIVISVILSVKDIIPNIFAGIVIHKKKFLNIGDRIQVKDMVGTIREIGLTEVIIQSKNKDLIRIPNSIITNNQVIKKTK